MRRTHQRILTLFCCFFLSFSLLTGSFSAFLPFVLTHEHTSAIAQSPDQNTGDLSNYQQGTQFYQAGQYPEAIQAWQQTLTQLEAQGNSLNLASVLSNLALAYQQMGELQRSQEAIDRSITILSAFDADADTSAVFAQVWNTSGNLNLLRSQPQVAFDSFETAAPYYEAAGDIDGKLSNQLNQLQALQSLGQYYRALVLLKDSEIALSERPDSLTKVAGFQMLGNLWRISGDLEASQASLEKALATAEQINDEAVASVLISLGHTAEAAAVNDNYSEALRYYQDSTQLTTSKQLQVRAKLNQLALVGRTSSDGASNTAELNRLHTAIKNDLDQLPANRVTLSARLDLVRQQIAQGISPETVVETLRSTKAQAIDIQDKRAESYSLGYLGELYANQQRWTEARTVLQQALDLSKEVESAELSYQWYWQLGKVLAQQGERQQAIDAYQFSRESLDKIQANLASTNPDTQFSFLDEVEPVYRELVSLLLNDANPSDTSEANLIAAQQAIESLQVSELVNFFRADCIEAKSEDISKKATDAAVIYPIVLSDRLEIVLDLPDQELRHIPVQVPQSDIENAATTLANIISSRPGSAERRASRAGVGVFSNGESITGEGRDSTSQSYRELSQQLYGWLIAPIESYITSVDTLVFVLDGAIRNLPVSVLYDGNQYLVEKYAIAQTPGLKLLDDSQQFEQDNLAALVSGLSDPVQSFGALPNVLKETRAIQDLLQSDTLINEAFTKASFQSKLNSLPFPIVHLATHGKFGSDLESTFILTHDETINANELSSWLKFSEINRNKAIELLVLSACETATGDNRAALGLAGIAVRSGARSTLATLWQVDDRGTADLMEDFYQQLSNNTDTKAKMLQKAQQTLLEQEGYQDPYFWAPFVLIGNWL